MFGRLRKAFDGLVDSLIGFKADVDETRAKWRDQFRLDEPETLTLPEPEPARTSRRRAS